MSTDPGNVTGGLSPAEAGQRGEGPLHLLGEMCLDIAHHSTRGRKSRNEDAISCFMPTGASLATKGACAVIADGVSSAEAAAEAARFAAEEFVADYYDSPDSWTVKTAGQKVLTAINRTLYGRSHQGGNSPRGHLCTFSALILKSDRAHVFHIGDSRIYRLRGDEFRQLTQDHSIAVAEDRTYLSRALGMDVRLEVDYHEFDLLEGDVFLLCTDGISDPLSADKLHQVLRESGDMDTACQALTRLAYDAGSQDNISSLLLQVTRLRAPDINKVAARLGRLPFPPDLKPGHRIDGYRIRERFFESARSHLYRVTDEHTGRQLILKAPSENYRDDPSYIERFIMEEWVGLRLQSPYIVRVVSQLRPRQFLYYLMEEVEGQTLEDWMQTHPRPEPSLALHLVAQIAEGLKAFHQRETYHQDLKPGNIMITPDHQIKIIDFGSVHVAGIDEIAVPLERDRILGTVNYTDPALRFGTTGGVRSDLFSLATITYQLVTGHLPYGETLEHCTRAEHLDRLHYIPADRFEPIIPVWFDRALEKALSPHPEHRYHSLDAFLQDLSEPNPELIEPRDRTPSAAARTSLIFWQVMSAIWLVSLIFLVVAFWLMD